MKETDRLRQHPEDRLAAPVSVLDLAERSAQLKAEPHASVSGHRQIALFRNGPVTLVLFVFDEGGLMKEHHAEGPVTIHVLRGQIDVTVADQTHSLTAGQLVGLAAGIPHTVHAPVASEMLLSVCKTGAVRSP